MNSHCINNAQLSVEESFEKTMHLKPDNRAYCYHFLCTILLKNFGWIAVAAQHSHPRGAYHAASPYNMALTRASREHQRKYYTSVPLSRLGTLVPIEQAQTLIEILPDDWNAPRTAIGDTGMPMILPSIQNYISLYHGGFNSRRAQFKTEACYFRSRSGVILSI